LVKNCTSFAETEISEAFLSIAKYNLSMKRQNSVFQFFVLLTVSSIFFWGCDSYVENPSLKQLKPERVALSLEWQSFSLSGGSIAGKGDISSKKFQKDAARYLKTGTEDFKKISSQVEKFKKLNPSASSGEIESFTSSVWEYNSHVNKANQQAIYWLITEYPELQQFSSSELADKIASAATLEAVSTRRGVAGKALSSQDAVGYSEYNCEQCYLTLESERNQAEAEYLIAAGIGVVTLIGGIIAGAISWGFGAGLGITVGVADVAGATAAFNLQINGANERFNICFDANCRNPS